MGFTLKPKAGIASYLQGALSYDAATTDPLSGTINDLNVANSSDVSAILLNATAAFTINGLIGGTANRQVELINQSAFTGTLVANAAGSQAANRFAAGATIPTGATVQLVYSGILNLWCVDAGASGGGGTLPGGTNGQLQFNDNNVFGGAHLTWDKNTNTLTGSLTLDGAITFIDDCNIDDGLFLVGKSSPSALAAGNTNNYSPVGLGQITSLRLLPDPTSGSTLTGLVALAAGAVITLFNIQTGATGNLTLAHQNAGSSDSNKFICPSEVDLVIPAGSSASIWYDSSSSRWRVKN